MGTKKQGQMVLKGSLRTHWMMYINVVNLELNPACIQSLNTANYMHRMLMNLNSKFVQPGFEFKRTMLKPQSYYTPSFLHLKFVNGYERKYNIGATSMTNIQHDVKEINKYVEYERAMQGQDDELEDDEV